MAMKNASRLNILIGSEQDRLQKIKCPSWRILVGQAHVRKSDPFLNSSHHALSIQSLCCTATRTKRVVVSRRAEKRHYPSCIQSTKWCMKARSKTPRSRDWTNTFQLKSSQIKSLRARGSTNVELKHCLTSQKCPLLRGSTSRSSPVRVRSDSIADNQRSSNLSLREWRSWEPCWDEDMLKLRQLWYVWPIFIGSRSKSFERNTKLK